MGGWSNLFYSDWTFYYQLMPYLKNSVSFCLPLERHTCGCRIGVTTAWYNIGSCLSFHSTTDCFFPADSSVPLWCCFVSTIRFWIQNTAKPLGTLSALIHYWLKGHELHHKLFSSLFVTRIYVPSIHSFVRSFVYGNSPLEGNYCNCCLDVCKQLSIEMVMERNTIILFVSQHVPQPGNSITILYS